MNVPQIDLNAPLPTSQEVVVDTVMVKAKREWYGGIVVFGVFILTLGGVGWGYSMSNNQAPITNKQTITPNNQDPIINNQTIEPNTQIVKPVFAVWNGSGVAGAAGKMADKLKAAGYEVVETKNAPKEQVGTSVEIDSLLVDQQAEMMGIVGVENVPAGPGLAGYVIVPARPGPMGVLEYSVKVIIGK